MRLLADYASGFAGLLRASRNTKADEFVHVLDGALAAPSVGGCDGSMLPAQRRGGSDHQTTHRADNNQPQQRQTRGNANQEPTTTQKTQ